MLLLQQLVLITVFGGTAIVHPVVLADDVTEPAIVMVSGMGERNGTINTTKMDVKTTTTMPEPREDECVHHGSGVASVISPYNVSTTIERVLDVVRNAGFTVFARVNHAQLAHDANLFLLPNEVVMFGSPAGGTPFMQDSALMGIDLPLKAHAHEDTDGVVHLSWNEPSYMTTRHGVSADDAMESRTTRMTVMLEQLMNEAVKGE
ncbi:DUF302 domain-containing protein [Pseudoscourfieldia marina]